MADAKDKDDDGDKDDSIAKNGGKGEECADGMGMPKVEPKPEPADDDAAAPKRRSRARQREKERSNSLRRRLNASGARVTASGRREVIGADKKTLQPFARPVRKVSDKIPGALRSVTFQSQKLAEILMSIVSQTEAPNSPLEIKAPPGSNLIEVVQGSSVEVIEEGEGKAKKVKVRGHFGNYDAATANKRLYPKTLWEREITRHQKAMTNGRCSGSWITRATAGPCSIGSPTSSRSFGWKTAKFLAKQRF
jgi:hypothetical protein